MTEEPKAVYGGSDVNEFGFPHDESDLSGTTPEAARTYIEHLLDVSAADAKNYAQAATVEVAVLAFLVKDSITAIKGGAAWMRIAGVSAVAALTISAASLFLYSILINLRRMIIVRTLAATDTAPGEAAVRARALWVSKRDGMRGKYGAVRGVGLVALGLGAAAAAAVVMGPSVLAVAQRLNARRRAHTARCTLRLAPERAEDHDAAGASRSQILTRHGRYAPG
jgi:hypothetical protein